MNRFATLTAATVRPAALLGALLIALATAGCGQKGPLYLPDKNGSVVTRPGGAAQNPSQTSPPTQAPKKKDDDSGTPAPPKQP